VWEDKDALARAMVANRSKSDGSLINKFVSFFVYKQSFAQSAEVIARVYQIMVKLSVSLRDTKSYFEEYLVTYADQLDIKDFINIVKNIGE